MQSMDMEKLPLYDHDHPAVVTVEMMKALDMKDWMTGTSGGVSVKSRDRIYTTPYGAQNNIMQPDDLFVMSEYGKILESPHPAKNLKINEFCPILLDAFTKRGAGAVIHSHSKNVVCASMFASFGNMKVSNFEMIRRITNNYSDKKVKLVVPVIDNSVDCKELLANIDEAMMKYPDTNAVIIRRHGIYVWGDTLQAAKETCESYDYLCDIYVRMFPHINCI